jgi:hypothetical protein
MNRGNDKKYPVNAFLMKKVMKYVVINKWSWEGKGKFYSNSESIFISFH